MSLYKLIALTLGHCLFPGKRPLHNSLIDLINVDHRSVNSTTDVKFVNTSMHGVGHYFVTKAFKAVGLRPFIPVEEQREPDPDFPTVKFPNPEEKGTQV